MSRNDDHTAISMMTGDTIQRRLRSLDRLLLGVQNTIGIAFPGIMPLNSPPPE